MEKVNLKNKLDKDTYNAILGCINVAKAANIKIFLVGGIVRDILLNKKLKDVDITVEGNAKQFVEILDCYVKTKRIKYNEKLPTVKVTFSNGTEIDFASTRTEVYEQPGVLPKVVKTGCPLKEDIGRRDFTVNSIAISLNKENLFEIIDYTGGIKDLKNKQLRVLHNKSFYDDPSRIIRGLKFAERLDFCPEKQTLKLQKEYLKSPLRNIPLERVKNELKDLFSLNTKRCFDDFMSQGLFRIFEENCDTKLNGQKIKDIIFEFDIKEEDFWLLYFLPLFEKSLPDKKLNLNSRELKIVEDIQNFRRNPLKSSDDYSIYEYFIKKDYLSAVFYGMLYNLKTAKRFNKIKNKKTHICGEDLKNLGIMQGKIYSEIQQALLKEILNHGLKNKSEEIEFVKANYINRKN